MTVSKRKTRTQLLTQAAMHYWVKLRFGVNLEMGICSWGKLRADVLAISMKGDVIIGEVKSGRADFVSDQKMEQYLPYCNQLYLVIGHDDTWVKEFERDLQTKGIGILRLEPDGYLKVYKKAPKRKMDGKIKKSMILRIAWRNAVYSKRTVVRRQRIYLE